MDVTFRESEPFYISSVSSSSPVTSGTDREGEFSGGSPITVDKLPKKDPLNEKWVSGFRSQSRGSQGGYGGGIDGSSNIGGIDGSDGSNNSDGNDSGGGGSSNSGGNGRVW
uniref:Trihydrophobin-like n=1 Tax=Elaeis guineensis var. tenera TaxID=51953 RepID=A0A6I9QM90_ELAGV|nr:trihydrophobin-like [Elaeis guineensis]